MRLTSGTGSTIGPRSNVNTSGSPLPEYGCRELKNKMRLNFTQHPFLVLICLSLALGSPRLRAQATEDQTVTLTLREAVQRAIAASPEVEAERITLQRSQALVQAARGIFDPIVRIGGDLRRETRPSSSVLEAPSGRLDEHLASGSVGFAQRLPRRGILFDSSVENTRISSTNPFLGLNPYNSPRVRLGLTLPLLRGAATDAERTELLLRKREATAGKADLEARLADVVRRVATAYWQLVAARQSQVVAAQTLEVATESLRSTERLVREGEHAETELSGARGQVARAEEAVVGARGVVRQTQQALQSLLAASASDPIIAAEVVPSEQEAQPDTGPLPELLAQALESRPELRAVGERVQAQADRMRLAANDRLPRADVQLTYLSQGLTGRENTTTSITLPGSGLDFDRLPPDFGGGPWVGFRQIGDNRFPTYAGSLRLELPLRNRAAEGRYAEAVLAERQAKVQGEQLRIQVALEVRQASAALSAARDRMLAAEQAEQASAQRLASELRLFREGQSTNLNLNVRQNELAESRQLVVRAREMFNTAATDLTRATGNALERFGVVLEKR